MFAFEACSCALALLRSRNGLNPVLLTPRGPDYHKQRRQAAKQRREDELNELRSKVERLEGLVTGLQESLAAERRERKAQVADNFELQKKANDALSYAQSKSDKLSESRRRLVT